MQRSSGRAGAVLVLAAAMGLGMAPGAASQGAKVEQQVLVVGEPGLQYGISPRGQHLAAVVLRGSRQVMVHDGVDGPKFDQILDVPLVGGSFTKVTWSEDGSRYAYVGRVGQEYVVLVDGKEAARGPWLTELVARGLAPVVRVGFAPGGKHWYLVTRTANPNGQQFQLAIDGKPGPASEGDIDPVFSPDGEHHAYMYSRKSATGQPSWALIRDGKPTTYLAGEPQFTADGLHLFTKRAIPGTGSTEVLADGVPFMRGESIQLHMAPVGPGVLGVVWTPFVNSVRSAFLTVGSRKVPGSDCTASAGLDGVYISADGKHFAARCPSAWMLVDGKKSMDYPGGLSDLAFTADGRAVYQAGSNGKFFMIVGDQESDGYASIAQEMARTRAQQNTQNFQPPPAVIRGNTVAYVARLSLNDQRTAVVVNGKAYLATNAGEVSVSPDGSRHAFSSGHPYQSVTLDGVAIPELTIDPSLAGIGYQGNFQWTPDSKHIAWVAHGEGRTRPGVAIDGKFFPTQAAPRYLSFTKDGRTRPTSTGRRGRMA